MKILPTELFSEMSGIKKALLKVELFNNVDKLSYT